MQEVNLSTAHLKVADLSVASLAKTNLRKARLFLAQPGNMNLERANPGFVDLTEVKVSEEQLQKA